WAVGGLSAKNTLTSVDAGLVEEAFTAKLLQVTGIPIGANTDVNSSAVNTARDYIPAVRPRRRRDKIHRRFVSAQACVICGRQPSDAHHLGFAQARALGSKVSDEFTVPLCRSHHRELHRAGDEVRWWARFGIDPIAIADKLWSRTHPVPISEATASADSGMSGSQVQKTNLPRALRPAKLRNKPNLASSSYDVTQTDRSQPAQCAQKHGSTQR